MTVFQLLFRWWYYFRIGYATYLAFIIGFVSNLVVIFKLGIEPIETAAVAAQAAGQQPSLLGTVLRFIFPNLTYFTIIATLLTLPIGIFAGDLHMRRTGAFAAEASVSTENNPYAYKVVPGKEQQVYLPLSILSLRGLEKLMERDKMLSEEERKEWDQVLASAEKLLAGHAVRSKNTG